MPMRDSACCSLWVVDRPYLLPADQSTAAAIVFDPASGICQSQWPRGKLLLILGGGKVSAGDSSVVPLVLLLLSVELSLAVWYELGTAGHLGSNPSSSDRGVGHGAWWQRWCVLLAALCAFLMYLITC
jgi:hypothetical protein